MLLWQDHLKEIDLDSSCIFYMCCSTELLEPIQFTHRCVLLVQSLQRVEMIRLAIQKFKEENILHMKTSFHFKIKMVAKSEEVACSRKKVIYFKI
jgi:hypothetical protein